MIPAVAAFLVSVLVLAPLVPVLRTLQVLDVPNERSSHNVATPRGGGVGVMLGVVVGGLVAVALDGPDIALPVGVTVGVALLVAVVGLVDDLRNLGATTRLAAQVLAGLVGGAAVLLSAQVGHIWLLALPVAMVWIVAFVNAFNFMDGINGISGITGAVAGTWFAYLGVDTGDRALAVAGAVLAGACVGFLPWNLFRAKVFLGDVGSYGVGCLIGILALWVAVEHRQPMAALAPTALYLADTGVTLVRRWRRGASLTTAHREHAYQRVTQQGWAHAPISLAIGVLTAACCLLVGALPFVLAAAGMVLVAGAYVSAPIWLPQPKSEVV